MTDQSHEPDMQHELKNQLAIISGYCDLLLSEAPPEHAWHRDLLEIQKAAAAALALLNRKKENADPERHHPRGRRQPHEE